MPSSPAPCTSNGDAIEARLDRLARQPFRARFHLRGKDRAYAQERGIEALRAHATDLIGKRVAPAAPANDGKQTPYRGHPVFVAQHATATCCRSCLSRWHHIDKGRALTPAEVGYVVEVIGHWIVRELAAGAPSDVPMEKA